MLQDVSAEHAVNAERERTAQFQQQMLGIVGHDLRAPLGAILIGTELLAVDTKDLPAAGFVVKRITSSANRMHRMVSQLLDMTRARLGGGIPLARCRMQLLPLIRSSIEELSMAHQTARFELVAPSEVTGLWDPDRLGQVVSNVLGNAVHHGLTGAPIVVGVTSSEDAVTIAIHNELAGPPIPPAMIATLFEPFRRGRDHARNGTGLGLGLYIVHEIVRAHGGTIVVESSPSGTTCRLVLPCLPRS